MMNLKKSWTKKYGKSQIITKENSSCKNVEIDMLRLADGDAKHYSDHNREYGLVILGGRCSVEGGNFRYEEIGGLQVAVSLGSQACIDPSGGCGKEEYGKAGMAETRHVYP